MRGGGRGGGGRQPFAAPDGADAGAIPTASRKMVQSLKGILADRSEGEIYATLCDCGMDPDIAVERLISQDTFHEVRRKRDKKKETKPSQESRPRSFQKPVNRGHKSGSDRSGRDSMGFSKGPIKKETELHAPLNSSALDVKTSNPTETVSATSNFAQADAKNTTQPPSQVQHGWGGNPGRPSMAEIVKRGRPEAKVASRSVPISTSMPAAGDSVISDAPSHTPKEYNRTASASEPNGAIQVHSVPKDASSVDMLPPADGADVPAPPKFEDSSTPDVNEDDTEKSTDLEGNTESLTISGQFSASGKDKSEYTEVATHQGDDSIEKTNEFQSNGLSFEPNQNLNGDTSTTAKQIDQLTLHEEPKSSDDNPAVIIPDLLQRSGGITILSQKRESTLKCKGALTIQWQRRIGERGTSMLERVSLSFFTEKDMPNIRKILTYKWFTHEENDTKWKDDFLAAKEPIFCSKQVTTRTMLYINWTRGALH